MRFLGVIWCTLCCLILLSPLTALGETSPFLLDRHPDGQLGFGYRFQHPNLASDLDTDLFMGFHEVSVDLPAGSDLVFSLAVPWVKWGFEGSSDPAKTTGLGNTTLAVHILNLGARDNTSLLFGVQLPTAQDESGSLMILGLVSHPSVWQTFIPDVLTIQTHFAVDIPTSGESFVRLEFGPDILFPTGDSSGSPTAHLRYGAGFGVNSGRVGASIEFAGFWEIDGDMDSFAGNSAHMLAAGVEYSHSVVRPALYYQVSTDERFDDLLDGVLGIRFTIKP